MRWSVSEGLVVKESLDSAQAGLFPLKNIMNFGIFEIAFNQSNQLLCSSQCFQELGDHEVPFSNFNY